MAEVVASPANARWFVHNHETFGMKSHVEVVQQPGRYKGSYTTFQLINRVKGYGFGVFDINPTTYALEFVGVFDLEGNDASDQKWPTKRKPKKK